MKKKNIFPVFGFLVIFWVCSFFTVSSRAGRMYLLPAGADSEQEEISAPEQSGGSEITGENQEETFIQLAFLTLNTEQKRDLILGSYRDPGLQDDVLAFFTDITNSPDIAELILFHTSAVGIPPALAFALCAEESNYNPRAINRNRNDTTDRGLFQLNSTSFPHLSDEDFYNPEINARYGLSHLRWCLNTAETEIAALAMYNAGASRVRSAGAPHSTLNYISRILSRQRKIEESFMAEYARIVQNRIAEAESARAIEIPPVRISHLAPIGRKR